VPLSDREVVAVVARSARLGGSEPLKDQPAAPSIQTSAAPNEIERLAGRAGTEGQGAGTCPLGFVNKTSFRFRLYR